MHCNVLAFIFNKPLPEHSIAKLDMACKSTPVDGITFSQEFFSSQEFSPPQHLRLSPPRLLLRQMPIGFYRQVALDFPAWFDFYGKFLGLTFTFKFSAKVSEYFTPAHHRGPELCIQSWLDSNISPILYSHGLDISNILCVLLINIYNQTITKL